MSEKKYYVLGCTTPETWEYVNTVLTQDGSLDDNIPSRPVECTDLKEQSPTRAVYLLTDQEAEQLSQCPDVSFIQINQSSYPDLYPPIPDQIRCTPNRYSSAVKNYRNFSGLLPVTPNSTDLNRAGYQLLRSAQYANPWQGQPTSTIISNAIPNTYTGKNVDVIVGDEGCWFGHTEFNDTGTGPSDYVAGNKLPGNGTCGVLDVVLDGTYYIDPDWYDANPSLLMTRWDGTIVPTEAAAREWWGNSAARSSQFSTAGTVTINPNYTRANCNGSNTAETPGSEGQHGTACSGQAFGRTYGWAYNANKWFIDAYGSYGLWPVDNYFDVMKIFHLNKPINPLYGTRDPTINSNSWGYRESIPTTGYYYFRQGTSGTGGVAYTGTKPNFMYYLGSAGDGGRAKGEMLTNNLTTSGDELIASGVIFVAAAGNSNQQQVASDNANFNNYWATAASTPLASAYHISLDGISYCYNTTNRRGFPQQLGKYTDGSTVVYPVINIGALDDDNQPSGLERKVNYSDMGDQIDCYAPGDGTLTSNQSYSPQYARYDNTYTGATVLSYDCRFSGTSSACPTATGLIATALETNRSWGWQEVRTWLQSLTDQTDLTFYQGPDPTTATDTSWSDLNSLMGGTKKVVYNNISAISNTVTVGGTGLSISGTGLTITLG